LHGEKVVERYPLINIENKVEDVIDIIYWIQQGEKLKAFRMPEI